jgi:5,5'-dehydrodivanillate O-demethylase
MTAIDEDLRHRRERNDRLTRVGPGTPMGAYMRRFWHPVAALVELDAWPVKKVRLLGEDLALFRNDDGSLGLVAERCPHRGASLACAMTDGQGIRCAYHGWKFEKDGTCSDTPAEPAGSKLRERMRVVTYPVEVMGGLVWAYLGPQPVPLVPRYEHLVAEGWNRSTGVSRLPCNWLQVAENSLDPLHVEFLHMKYTNWARAQLGQPPIPVRKHARVGYDLFDYGIVKKRLWEGDREDSQEWTIGHPLIFPGTLLVPYHAGWVQFQFRVPVDDTTTICYWYDAKLVPAGEAPRTEVPIWENPWQTPDGKFMPEKINPQDMMVWITQGSITDHTLENLGESDRGVALYRRTLLDEVARVERGEDPMGVVRDPAKNTPYIELPIEREVGYSLAGAATSAMYAFPERDGTEIPLPEAVEA